MVQWDRQSSDLKSQNLENMMDFASTSLEYWSMFVSLFLISQNMLSVWCTSDCSTELAIF